MPDEPTPEPGIRPLWSGSLSFGLVNVPVRLHAVVRRPGTRLRMVDEDGTPLSRRWVRPDDGEELTRDELVHGYELGEGEHEGEMVTLSDEELETLAPERTEEMELERFVDESDLDPVLFDRPYLMEPGTGPTKPYRLLARTLERSGRAGIAHFVLRTREHPVAILARDGVLRAQTLRWPDEIRSPEAADLPDSGEADPDRVDVFVDAVESARADGLDRAWLVDPRREQLEEIRAEDDDGS